MKDIIKEFLDYIYNQKRYSVNTKKNYEIDLYKFADFITKNNLDYLNLKYENIADFIKSLKKSKYKNSSINRMLSTLRSFYNYLLTKDKINSNPMSVVKDLKTEKKLPVFFKYSDFEKMVDSIIDNSALNIRNKLILELLLASGVRVSELVAIKIADIDQNNREIKILGKGNKERIVYFKDYCLKALNKYLTEARNELLKGSKNDYLLINNKGNNLTDRGVRLIIDKIIKETALNIKVSPHAFRHSFATMLINEGCDIKTVQELLGHSSIGTTSIYTHLTNEKVRSVYLASHPRAKKQ